MKLKLSILNSVLISAALMQGTSALADRNAVPQNPNPAKGSYVPTNHGMGPQKGSNEAGSHGDPVVHNPNPNPPKGSNEAGNHGNPQPSRPQPQQPRPQPAPQQPRPQPQQPAPQQPRPNNPPPHNDDHGNHGNNGGNHDNHGNGGGNPPPHNDDHGNNGGNHDNHGNGPGPGNHDDHNDHGGNAGDHHDNHGNFPGNHDNHDGHGDHNNHGNIGGNGGYRPPYNPGPSQPPYQPPYDPTPYQPPYEPAPYDPSDDGGSDESSLQSATVSFEAVSRATGGEWLRVGFTEPAYVDYVNLLVIQAGVVVHDAYLVTESGRHVPLAELVNAGELDAPAGITSDYVVAGERITAIDMRVESMGGDADISVTVSAKSEQPPIFATRF